MRERQSAQVHESRFHFGELLRELRAVTAKHVGHAFDRLLVLVFVVFGSALAVAAAQTGASRATQIQEHLRQAGEDLKANDANSAVGELEAVLALDPKNVEAYANLGVISFIQHDYQNAAQNLRKALAIDPSIVKTQALLGICELRLGDPSAQALLEKSFPKLKDKSLKIQTGMELASVYYQEGDLDRAASVMRSLVDLDSDNIEILYMAQKVYSDLADDTLNKLAILAPGSARMQQVIAERLINEGDLKGAIEHYRKALELDPHLPGAHYELGEAILQSAQTDPTTQTEAQKEFDAAAQLEGDNAQLECQLGKIAYLQANMDQAFAHYKRAFGLNPQDVDAQMGLGQLFAVMGKPEEAVKYLRMAVASDPLNSEAHYRLATNCRKLGLTAEAEKELKLFQEIKQTKDRVKALYRQMNVTPKEQDDQLPGDKP
ncbi:MAG: tetratricopeptide repeat protein [Candidatus Acidiferrum sp.]